ncbi:MAG: IclR family transcriptional regulator [Acidobacteria bacterium]|nr:IclR family transcriptional regulator [Acidobacteriota bacterium]
MIPSQSDDKYMVPVLRSTFQILGELSIAGTLNLNDLVVRTGLPKSTVFRILRSLSQLGYVLRNESQRTYWLSPKFGDLSHAGAWSEPLRRAARPHMLKLRDLSGETVNLGLLDLDRVMYIEVVPSVHPLRLCERPGGWEYLHASALGKAMLAYCSPEFIDSMLDSRELPALTPKTVTAAAQLRAQLAEVRRSGYALDEEETTLLGNCVGVPLFDSAGAVVAALSISGPTSRFNPREDNIIRALKAEAAAVSASYGYSPLERDVPVLLPG